MIDHLRKAGIRTHAAVLFLYCDYRDQVNQSFVNVVGSLAKQLGLQAPSIPTAIWELYKRMVNAQHPINLDVLHTMINIFVKLFDCVYICVDGLDECHPDTRRQLLEFFKTITGTTLKLFVTGRPNIEDELTTCMADKSVSKMPIVAKREDLQIYLSEKFSQDPYPEAMDMTLQTQITDRIIQWSQGM